MRDTTFSLLTAPMSTQEFSGASDSGKTECLYQMILQTVLPRMMGPVVINGHEVG